MKNVIKITLIALIFMLTGCGTIGIEEYKDTKPVMKFDDFFNGPLVGHAIVQDRSGKVIRTFTVDMVGTWNGSDGELKEHFVYSDGKTQDRVWKIKKVSENEYVGWADDIVGEAKGRSEGQAILWKYVMKLEVGGSMYNIAFDDWMYIMNDKLVINRSIMKKFGIKVGELTISIQKK